MESHKIARYLPLLILSFPPVSDRRIFSLSISYQSLMSHRRVLALLSSHGRNGFVLARAAGKGVTPREVSPFNSKGSEGSTIPHSTDILLVASSD